MDDLASEMQHQRNVQVGIDIDRVGNLENHQDFRPVQHDIANKSKDKLRQMYSTATLSAWLKKKRAKLAGFDKWDSRYFVLYGNTLRYFKSEEDAQEHSAWLQEQVSA